MFNMKRYGQEYHIELTRHFSDKRKLCVYALRVDDPLDKQCLLIDTFETLSSEHNGDFGAEEQKFVQKYIEDHLLLSWRADDKEKTKMAHI